MKLLPWILILQCITVGVHAAASAGQAGQSDFNLQNARAPILNYPLDYGALEVQMHRGSTAVLSSALRLGSSGPGTQFAQRSTAQLPGGGFYSAHSGIRSSFADSMVAALDPRGENAVCLSTRNPACALPLGYLRIEHTLSVSASTPRGRYPVVFWMRGRDGVVAKKTLTVIVR